MVHALIRLMVLICFGSLVIIATLLPFAATVSSNGFRSIVSLAVAILLIFLAIVATLAFNHVLNRLGPFIDSNAEAQAKHLDSFNPVFVDLAIVFSAALSLFLELAIIRWQSTVLDFFAFYKSFSLLACFLGLGLGYALSTRDRIPLILVIPLLTWQLGFMMLVRFGPGTPFHAIPFREQLAMGINVADLRHTVVLYALLTVVFLMTAVAFVPVGQLCGRLMERRVKLRSYGLNLLGSLLGVLTMLVVSFLWTPPIVWFALCFLGILPFQLRKASTIALTFVFTVVCTIILAWPVDPLWNRVYSPYQLLEIGQADNTGQTMILAAGHYYQRIHDLSGERLGSQVSEIRSYYDFPYKAHPDPISVAIVGSGTGNDAAAALRAGAGHVEAIEIDPAILLIGRSRHPEKPYDNPRVHAVVSDARSFFRRTDQKFDLIVYGLLDSHTLLSHGSSVRIDSFVYTLEGLREARNRLTSDGVLSLSFSILTETIGRKIYLMMQQAFDGRPPICVRAGYDRSVIFLESNNERWRLPSAVIENAGFKDQTAYYANAAVPTDVSTDDWPFFYMPRRVYPLSYLVMIFQILALSLLVTVNFVAEMPRFSNLSFFFLGAGFMLVETKGITEMGLTFGNTWQVIGFVIAGILIMAFLGNAVVKWLTITRPVVPYLFLVAALAIGWFVAGRGGFASTSMGKLETAFLLTCPVLFSGIVFSTLVSTRGQVSGIMASNLLGAICGGLLEYNSMYFGFRSLYLVAMACYLLAFASELAFVRSPSATPGTTPVRTGATA
jgi:spermidine synthase